MGINLAEFEAAAPFDGDYHAALSALQQRLAQLQFSQIIHRKRVVVLFEGWEGSGRKAALKRLCASWDPCYFVAHCVRSGGFDQQERHWLAPYWSALPMSGRATLFFRSWYRRLVDQRALGEMPDQTWSRAFDEINEFEAQQSDHGTLLIKLFFHLSADAQAERLHQRRQHPWRQWSLSPEDLQGLSARDGYLAAWQEMFDRSDTRWAPWRVIAGGDKRTARIAALSAVADALEAAMPQAPPATDENVVLLAQERFG